VDGNDTADPDTNSATNKFVIAMVATSDSGNYTCMAMNGVGEPVTVVVEVRVQGMYKFGFQFSDILLNFHVLIG
jgi:hypothetical protein